MLSKKRLSSSSKTLSKGRSKVMNYVPSMTRKNWRYSKVSGIKKELMKVQRLNWLKLLFKRR